jgi:hypothetical protein
LLWERITVWESGRLQQLLLSLLLLAMAPEYAEFVLPVAGMNVHGTLSQHCCKMYSRWPVPQPTTLMTVLMLMMLCLHVLMASVA